MFVRRERFGNLIWSDKDKAYFIANNKGIDKQVDRIIQGIKKDLDVLEELKKMGLRENEKVREIYSDNVNISATYSVANTKIELIVSDSQYAYTEKECKITNSSIKLTKVEKE